ncbi:MAG TPA: YceI family protein [Arachidicoccus sp.]
MKRISFLSIAIIALLLCAFTFITSVKWQPKEGAYSVKFSADNASGIISGLKGSIDFDKNNAAQSKFDVSVDVNSLNTGNGLKNKHAKDAVFFDVAHYPEIHFTSTKIAKSASGFVATGNLSIKNVTKSISIPFTFVDKGSEAVFNGSFQINRKEFNLNRDGVGDVIKIDMSVPVTKK